MAFKSVHLTLVSTTATAAIVQGSGSTQFKTTSGTLQDPLPVCITNTDKSVTVYLGGPDVTDSNGTPIPPGGQFPCNLYGTGEIPYLYSTGTPIVAILCGRQ